MPGKGQRFFHASLKKTKAIWSGKSNNFLPKKRDICRKKT